MYLYSQCLLGTLSERMEDGILKASVKRFSQELEKGAQERFCNISDACPPKFQGKYSI